jgi:molecular chaperone GrpE
VLADFRRWLSEGPERRGEPGGSPEPVEPPDLHTLLGQMIAVRQEVNLQTKAVRGQQEQTTEALELLEQTLDELRKSKTTSQQQQQSPDDLLRPLLKTLIDAHDALSLAAKEARRVEENVLATLDALPDLPDLSSLQLASVEVPALEQPPRSILARILGVRAIDEQTLTNWQARVRLAHEQGMVEKLEAFVREGQQRGAEAKRGMAHVKQLLASLLAGYRMGLQRIERALQQHGLEGIPATGQAFDPERMEVLEAVDGTGRPAGEVLEEVRRGYLWRGRVFRYAQVRVARS